MSIYTPIETGPLKKCTILDWKEKDLVKNVKDEIGSKIEEKYYKWPRKTILIAEDEEPLRKMYKRTFESKWFIVLIAKNWKEAYDLATKKSPDLMLLDEQMPMMNWSNVVEKFRQATWNNDLPIIFASWSWDCPALREKLLSIHWVSEEDVIAKPIYGNLLFDRIVEVLNLELVDE